MNLIEIYNTFRSERDCHDYLISLRWPDGAECVYCNSKVVYRRSKGNRLKCRCCNKSFAVTVNTIFHSTKLPLSTWFFAIAQILAAKKGISSLQLARTLKVNKNTAWYMQKRIRAAMNSDAILQRFIRRQIVKKTNKGGVIGIRINKEYGNDFYRLIRDKGYFSLFKRAIIGQYHQLSFNHAHGYLHEIDFKRKFDSNKAFELLMIRACALW